MTEWRDVQEAIYQRFMTAWGARTQVQLGNERFDPPDAQWLQLLVQGRPGGPATIGPVGGRKVDRAGVVFILLREPPGNGVGLISDLASDARDVFEACRFGPHSLTFGYGDIGGEGDVDRGRWWGVVVEVPFGYEETK